MQRDLIWTVCCGLNSSILSVNVLTASAVPVQRVDCGGPRPKGDSCGSMSRYKYPSDCVIKMELGHVMLFFYKMVMQPLFVLLCACPAVGPKGLSNHQ